MTLYQNDVLKESKFFKSEESLKHSFTGLDPYVKYTLEIKGINRFGVISKESIKDFTTDEGGLCITVSKNLRWNSIVHQTGNPRIFYAEVERGL